VPDARRYCVEAIVTPVIRGQPVYRSYLIVSRNRPYHRLKDLRGRLFAFTDPKSNTGALVPACWLAKTGEDDPLAESCRFPAIFPKPASATGPALVHLTTVRNPLTYNRLF